MELSTQYLLAAFLKLTEDIFASTTVLNTNKPGKVTSEVTSIFLKEGGSNVIKLAARDIGDKIRP